MQQAEKEAAVAARELLKAEASWVRKMLGVAKSYQFFLFPYCNPVRVLLLEVLV
jgi:hypothetical protein